MQTYFMKQKGKSFKYPHLPHGKPFRILTKPWRYFSYEVEQDEGTCVYRTSYSSGNEGRCVFIVEYLDDSSLCYLDVTAKQERAISEAVFDYGMRDVHRLMMIINITPFVVSKLPSSNHFQEKKSILEATEYIDALQHHLKDNADDERRKFLENYIRDRVGKEN